jgi:hypothetical protein
VDRIISATREVLATLGVEIHNPGVLDMLGEHGTKVDPNHCRPRRSGEMRRPRTADYVRYMKPKRYSG